MIDPIKMLLAITRLVALLAATAAPAIAQAGTAQHAAAASRCVVLPDACESWPVLHDNAWARGVRDSRRGSSGFRWRLARACALVIADATATIAYPHPHTSGIIASDRGEKKTIECTRRDWCSTDRIARVHTIKRAG